MLEKTIFAAYNVHGKAEQIMYIHIKRMNKEMHYERSMRMRPSMLLKRVGKYGERS